MSNDDDMDARQVKSTSISQDMHNMEVKTLGETLLDFIAVVTKWRRFITRFVFATTIITIIVTLLMPKWYKATASVFPAEQTNLFAGLDGVSSLVKSLSGGGGKKLGGLTGSSDADRYVAILKSDRVLGAMISKFKLKDIYDFTNASYANEKTAKELIENTQIELQDEGNLTVSVFDKEPNRAAEMANYYIQLLNETNSELQVQNARGNREFIEQRYKKNLEDLREAEEAMKSFQLKHGVVAVPEQTEATIKAGAEMYAKLVSKEIELEVLRRSMTEVHPTVVAAKIEIEEIKQKMNMMNSGTVHVPDEVKILVPFRQAPGLSTDYVRHFRNLEIQNKILQFLTPLYEQAKIEERRSTPSVVILDAAGVPERKAKPKISLYALLAFVISLVVSLFTVFVGEGIERLRRLNPERFALIVGSLRSDWFGLRVIGLSRKNRKQD